METTTENAGRWKESKEDDSFTVLKKLLLLFHGDGEVRLLPAAKRRIAGDDEYVEERGRRHHGKELLRFRRIAVEHTK